MPVGRVRNPLDLLLAVAVVFIYTTHAPDLRFARTAHFRSLRMISLAIACAIFSSLPRPS
jgi:hypothetical protein